MHDSGDDFTCKYDNIKALLSPKLPKSEFYGSFNGTGKQEFTLLFDFLFSNWWEIT